MSEVNVEEINVTSTATLSSDISDSWSVPDIVDMATDIESDEQPITQTSGLPAQHVSTTEPVLDHHCDFNYKYQIDGWLDLSNKIYSTEQQKISNLRQTCQPLVEIYD